MITSSYLEGNEPFRSERYHVQGIECKREHGEFNYCHGLQEVWWPAEKTIINIEQDMECSDELIDGLLSCPHPLCAYAYLVYPTQLHRYIYCATSRQVDHNNPAKSNVYWLNKGEEWAVWSSIGFCKIDPIARVKPLDRLYWQWLEHSVNRIVGTYQHAGGAGFEWHIHWPEVEHYHDYKRIPDHLW